jgi:DNA-binding MarR family transcriptional regulator
MKSKPRTIYLLRQAQLLTYAYIADCLRVHQITPMQYMLLSISRREGEYSSADLARRFAVTPQTMNEAIAALRRKQLLKQTEMAEHRRILRISLTSKGVKLLQVCDRKIDAMEKRLFGGLSGDELDNLRAALVKFIRCARELDAGRRNACSVSAGKQLTGAYPR